MFIRRTRTRRTDTGQDYFTYRLVRADAKGRKCANAPCSWAVTTSTGRSGRRCVPASSNYCPATDLLDPDCPAALEATGRRPHHPRRERRRRNCTAWRSIPWQAVGLQQLGVPALLVRLGLPNAAALGSIIGRLAAPGSERAKAQCGPERHATVSRLGTGRPLAAPVRQVSDLFGYPHRHMT